MPPKKKKTCFTDYIFYFFNHALKYYESPLQSITSQLCITCCYRNNRFIIINLSPLYSLNYYQSSTFIQKLKAHRLTNQMLRIQLRSSYEENQYRQNNQYKESIKPNNKRKMSNRLKVIESDTNFTENTLMALIVNKFRNH